MFVSIEVELKALTEGKFSCSSALYVNALFYKLINDIEPAISERLHKMDEVKPYTLSGLYTGRLCEDLNSVYKDKSYKIRITFMEDSIFRAFNNSLYSYIKQNIPVMIGGQSFQVIKSELVRVESTEDIINKEVTAKSKFEIFFETPTCFRMKGINIIFPEAGRLIKSCSEKWNKFNCSNLIISDEEISKMAAIIYPQSFDLNTEILNMKNYKMIGFAGKCVYEIDKKVDEELLKKINWLLCFMHYSGIGYKTTMGMGQVYVLNAK